MVALRCGALTARLLPCYVSRHRSGRPIRAGRLRERGDVIDQPPAGLRGALHQLGPVVTAALMFTISDVFAKLALEGGSDVLSVLGVPRVLGLGLLVVGMRDAGTAQHAR